jgi:hypothetical protein
MITSLLQRNIYKASLYGNNSYIVHCFISSKEILKHKNDSLDHQQILYSLNKICTRHPILLSTFNYKDGILVSNYICTNKTPLKLEIIYVNENDNNATEYNQEDLNDLIFSIKDKTRFNLSSDYSIKSFLLRNTTYTIGILFLVHHIIFDGLSSLIFREEFTQIYNNVDLPPVKFSYQDYCNWEKTYINSLEFEKSLDWWKQKEIDKYFLDLPYSSLYPSSYSDILVQIINDIDVIKNWKQLKRLYNLTSFQLFQTLLVLLFWCITSQSHIVIHGIDPKRHNVNWEQSIGMFVNTLVYPFSVNKDIITFYDFVLDIRSQINDVIKHSKVPYEYISSKVPQIMITSSLQQNFFSLKTHSKFDLMIMLSDNSSISSDESSEKNNITLQWIFKKGMFDITTIKQFTFAFKRLASIDFPFSLRQIKIDLCYNMLFPNYYSYRT